MHCCSERQQRELGHLECLQAKGNPDDGEAIGDARDEIARRHGEAGAKQPDDVGDERRSPAAALDGLAKRRERERCHLERLAPERDSYDGNAEQTAHEKPINRSEDAAEEHSDDVADEAHGESLSKVVSAVFILRACEYCSA